MLEARLRFQMVPELLIGYQAVGLSEGRGSMSRKLATLCSIGLFAVATGVAHAATVETFDLTQDGFGVTGQTFAVVTLRGTQLRHRLRQDGCGRLAGVQHCRPDTDTACHRYHVYRELGG